MTRLFQFVAVGLMATAAPAAPERGAPAARQRPAPHGEVPGIVLFGMAAAGVAIVGVSARRRQPGRSVTD